MSCFDYMQVKDDLLVFSCFECKNKYQEDFNKDLIKKFKNAYEFCGGEIDKFILLLNCHDSPKNH